jgi:beta-galactosidase
MTKILKISLFSAFLLFSYALQAQIKVKSLPPPKISYLDYLFNDNISQRKIIPLNDGWKVKPENGTSGKFQATIPFIFEGSNTLVFERDLTISKDEINHSIIKLGFLGINHSIELSVNGANIFKRTGGEIPFELELPADIIKSDVPNKLTIKVNTKLNSETTIPVGQRFLFPKNSSGILRDIYLKIIPKTNISSFKFSWTLDSKLSSAASNLSITIDNLNFINRESLGKEGILLKFQLSPKNFSGSTYTYDFPITVSNSGQFNNTFTFNIPNPVLWFNETPNVYKAELSLTVNKELIDKETKEISFFKIDSGEKGLTLNNIPFSLKGVTYIVNESVLVEAGSLEKLKSDLTFIKKTGFNSVRFSKFYPHPAAAKLCQEMGLFSLVELPINSVPEEILLRNDFRLRAVSRFKEMLDSYSTYSNSNLWGLGSSYLSNSVITSGFLEYLLKNNSENSFYTYSSFLGIQKERIEGLDLYGMELYSNHPDKVNQLLEELTEQNNSVNYFFSEVNYPNYLGSSDGYLNKNSTESQAKYFSSIIELTIKNNFGGFFINTLLEYSGDFSSLYGGYSNQNIYKLGLFHNKTNNNNLVYKVIEARLNNSGKVTIPIGSSKDENKLLFILIALGLSVLMAVLINTRKKFREDCSRALFRPYNFFADIRDQRIISGLHTFILLLVESGAISLFFTILFSYLRTNLLVEKLLLSFGEPSLLTVFSYLAWNPEKSFVILFVLLIFKVAAISVLVKSASLLIKTKVQFASIFFMIVWSLLPFTILLPVELILYKILTLVSFNTLVIIFLILFWLWILQRIMKGVHVLFDVRRFAVYFYGLLIILFLIGSMMLYFQISNSTLYYITNSIKQYNLISY